MKNLKIALAAMAMSLMVAFGARAEVATPSNATSVETTVDETEVSVENDDQIVDETVVGDSDDDEYVVVEDESESDETVNAGSKDGESGDSFFDFPEVPEEPKDEPEDIPVATPSEPQRIPTQVVVTFTVPTIPEEPEDKPVATPSEAEKPEEPEDKPGTPDEPKDEPKQPETPDQPTVTPEEPEDKPVATPSNAEKPENPEETPDQPQETPDHPEHRVPQIPDVPVVRIVDEPVPESVEPIVVIPVYPGGNEPEHAVPAPVAEEVVPEYPATMTIPKTGDETPIYPVVLFFVALIGMVISAIGMVRNGEADETVAYTAARKAAATASVRESTNNADSLFGYNNLYSKAKKNFQHIIGECHTNVRGFPPFETRADNIHPPLE